MKNRTNIIFLLYEILIFLPVFIVLTVITAVMTILIAAIFGDVRWGYFPARIWSRLACFLTFQKVVVVGNENVNAKESVVYISNHQSLFDVFLIYGWLKTKFKWVMKKELRRIPFVGRACEAAGHIFIDRSNPMSAKRSMEIVAKKLINGNSAVIFPEGSRTTNGKIGRFKRGAFLLACDLKLPIVPITISGAFETLPRNSFFIKSGKLTLTIHEKIETKSYNHDNINELIEQTHEIIEKDL